MILPEAFEGGALPDLVVATLQDPFRFAGALAFEPALFDGRPAWDLRLHVVRGHRRRGIGTRLVRSLLRRAGAPRTLLAQHDVDEQTPAGPFLRRLGFRFCSRTAMHECDLHRYRDTLPAIRDRLVQRGRIPRDARVVPVHQAPRAELLRLHAEHLGGPLRWVDARLAQALDRPSWRRASVALLYESRVLGFVLTEVHGECAEVHSRAVVPEYRGGWANVLLGAVAFDRMVDCGVGRVRFSSLTATPDTERFVRLHGAERSRLLDRYVLIASPLEDHAS